MTLHERNMLRYVCGLVPPGSDAELELLSLDSIERDMVLRAVREYPAMVDPQAEELCRQGILRHGIDTALEYISDPDIRQAAEALRERLLDFAAVWGIELPDPKAAVPVGDAEADAEAIYDMLRKLGWDPREHGIDHEGILGYCQEVFAQSRQRRSKQPVASGE